MTPQYDGYIRLTCPIVAQYDKPATAKPKLATASMSPAAVRQSALYRADMEARRRFLASQELAAAAQRKIFNQVAGTAQ